MSDPTSVPVALGHQLLNRAPAAVDQGHAWRAESSAKGSLIEKRGARRAA